MNSTKTNRYSPLREIAVIYILILVVFKSFHLMGSTGRAVLGVLVPVTWVYLPVLLLHFKGRSFREYGLTLQNWKGGTRLALLVSAVILPLFVIGYYVFHGAILEKTIQPDVTWALVWSALTQVLVIAYPEEIFFRGYMQTHLNRLFTGRIRFLGASVGWSLILTSVLFAIGHFVIHPHPFRLAVFFPSLVFGWLREKTGSVYASGLFHGLANITILILGS